MRTHEKKAVLCQQSKDVIVISQDVKTQDTGPR